MKVETSDIEQPFGEWSGCHSIGTDANIPKVGDQGGSGLMSGAVFGKIAGSSAAKFASKTKNNAVKINK